MIEKFLNKLKAKESLTFDETKEVFEVLMSGKATDQEIYNFHQFFLN